MINKIIPQVTIFRLHNYLAFLSLNELWGWQWGVLARADKDAADLFALEASFVRRNCLVLLVFYLRTHLIDISLKIKLWRWSTTLFTLHDRIDLRDNHLLLLWWLDRLSINHRKVGWLGILCYYMIFFFILFLDPCEDIRWVWVPVCLLGDSLVWANTYGIILGHDDVRAVCWHPELLGQALLCVVGHVLIWWHHTTSNVLIAAHVFRELRLVYVKPLPTIEGSDFIGLLFDMLSTAGLGYIFTSLFFFLLLTLMPLILFVGPSATFSNSYGSSNSSSSHVACAICHSNPYSPVFKFWVLPNIEFSFLLKDAPIIEYS